MKTGGVSEEEGGDSASQALSGSSCKDTSEGVAKSLKSMLDDMCPVTKKKTRESDSDGDQDEGKPKRNRRGSRNNQTPNPEKDAEVQPAFRRVSDTNFPFLSPFLTCACQVDAKKKELQNMNKDINASEPQFTCNLLCLKSIVLSPC